MTFWAVYVALNKQFKEHVPSEIYNMCVCVCNTDRERWRATLVEAKGEQLINTAWEQELIG